MTSPAQCLPHSSFLLFQVRAAVHIPDLEEDTEKAEFDERSGDENQDEIQEKEDEGQDEVHDFNTAHFSEPNEDFADFEFERLGDATDDNADSIIEEGNINIFHEDNHQENIVNEDPNHNPVSFDLNHSNLDTVVNLRQGTKAKDLFVLALALSVRHNWNYEETIHYFQSQNATLDMPCLPQSKPKLFSVLREQASRLTYHAYCPKCRQYLGLKDNLGTSVKCTNIGYCQKVTIKSKLKYFVTLDLRSQLLRFLSIPGIAEKLKYRHTRKKMNVNSIQDIFDGTEYKRLLKEGVISDLDFTYVFNTDGVKILKGAKSSAWPLYIRINELPPSLRQKYLFLAGVWVDSVDPIMNVFLQPFVVQANDLSENGVSWKPDGVKTVVSKFVPICQCVDSKARYTLYNMSQFNASKGCTVCNVTGVQRGGARYPVLPPNDAPMPVLRTNETVERQMIEAECTLTTIEGIKGVSALMNMNHFGMMSGQALDDLHAFHEGNAKHHTDLLMRVKGQTTMKLRAEVVNTRLSKIKFPSQISRNVFDITKRKSWKGSMWRTWLLFCGTVCLQDLIPEKYISHFALLSHAVFLISQDEVMPEDLPVINQYIVKYVALFERYFGIDHMYYNIHLMLHFHDCLIRLGPSWVYSTFGFESWNRKCITMQIHSAQGAVDQVAHRHMIRTLVNVAQFLDLDLAPHIKEQLDNILLSKKRNVTYQVGNAYFLGEEKVKIAAGEWLEVLRREGYRGAVTEFFTYEKLLYRSVLYNAAGCSSRAQVDDSEVYTWKNTFGSVLCFVRFAHQGQEIAGVFMQEHDVNPLKIAKHVVKVESEETLLHFECVDMIRCPVLSIKLSNYDHFLVPLANCIEID